MSSNLTNPGWMLKISPWLTDVPLWGKAGMFIGGMFIGVGLVLFLTSKTRHKRPHTRKGDHDRYYTVEQWWVHILFNKIAKVFGR